MAIFEPGQIHPIELEAEMRASYMDYAMSVIISRALPDIRDGLKNILSEMPILEERYRRLLQHFVAAGVVDIEVFIKGSLASPDAEVALIHAAVGAMKDIKRRADFEACAIGDQGDLLAGLDAQAIFHRVARARRQGRVEVHIAEQLLSWRHQRLRAAFPQSCNPPRSLDRRSG